MRVVAVVALTLGLLGLTLAVPVRQRDDSAIVTAPAGSFRGIKISKGDQLVAQKFLGIPYAEPPTGEQRFRAPVPYPDIAGIKNVTSFADSCLQPRNIQAEYFGSYLARFLSSLTYSEDCLNLNVYVSGSSNSSNSTLKPVMVFLHGGAYAIGSANLPFHDGEVVSREGDMVVVTVNYRLGPMGFLATEDPESAGGNYGLMDQILALKWVQRNIHAFGGDPNNVMLTGNGAGAMSVSIHVMSPVSEGLFHKAGTQSGSHGGRLTAVMPYINELQTMKLAARLNCRSHEMDVMIECLRKVPAEAYVSAQEAEEYVFVPVIDGHILPEDQAKIIESGTFQKLPFFMGSTSQDGSVALRLYRRSAFTDGITDQQVGMAIDYVALLLGYMGKLREIRAAIRDEYFPEGVDDDLLNLQATLRMLTDFMFLAPEEHFLQYQALFGGTAFQYFHKARPTFKYQNPHIQLGADLGDDLMFIFGVFLEGGVMSAVGSSKERALSKSIIHAWSSFAHNGIPEFLDESGAAYSVPAYNLDNQTYLELDYHMSKESLKENLKPRIDVFWNEIIPAIGHDEDYDY